MRPLSHSARKTPRPLTLALLQIIYLRATGGEVGASSALAPKIGPLGLVSCGSVGRIIQRLAVVRL